MLAHIESYERNRANPTAFSAAQPWFAEVYEPLRREVRRQGLAQLFPGARSADIVVQFVSWSEAADGDTSWDHFVDSAAPYPSRKTVGGVLT